MPQALQPAVACAPDPPAPNALVGMGWRHPHYQAVLQTLPELDFLEVHSENFFHDGGAALALLLQARAHYPISLHGVGLSLGSADGVDAWHLEHLARLVSRVEPARVSDHACFARLGHPGVHAADLLPIPFDDEALDVICRNVDHVQSCLKRPIAVENLSAYVRWRDARYAEPQFLMALARRTGCELLVDVNNLMVNALNDAGAPDGDGDDAQRAQVQQALGHCRQWLDGIAPDVVAELHVAGHSRHDDEHGRIVIDDHGSRVAPEVWQLHAHALARFRGVPTLVEWDTDVPDLSMLLDEARLARCSGAARAEREWLAGRTDAGVIAR